MNHLVKSVPTKIGQHRGSLNSSPMKTSTVKKATGGALTTQPSQNSLAKAATQYQRGGVLAGDP